MGYRADFEILLKAIFETIHITRIDHDAKAKDGNKPDFAIMNNGVPILYIEAKDIGISLDKIEQSEQMARYYGYTNLVLTDYLEFRFYRNGLRYEDPIRIANFDIKNRTIKPIPENYENVSKTLIDFSKSSREPIRSGEHLAKIMGGKAQRLRDNVRHFLSNESEKNVGTKRVYETIKRLLVHDLNHGSFSDMYAQTIVYGLFVARNYDETPDNFTRQEARDLVPASNPFLRHFFDHIVGHDFDKRLEYIVDELCEVFSHANTKELMDQYYQNELFGKTKENIDPVIHFYEDFLKEYDPELRKKMGAFYTPVPVVRFIVRSVDHLLSKEFSLFNGLADTSKTATGNHRVHVLDLATGTGTFISAVIRLIYEKILKTGQQGRWPTYVHHDLLPRIHGFEIMMAPYTIAHLKLSMAFKETGFKYFNHRLGIYLTNSLEESVIQKDMYSSLGFADSIAEESMAASIVKNKSPIMVVIGNPPYSGESNNEFYKGHDVYKVEPAGGKLQERNSKWLNDDYVKFIRLAESMVEKNGEGIIGMITAHGYLDNPTFRGMRYHLMKTFDAIYVLDLHGNSNKKEKAPDGSKDENVFDIKQGVSIIFGIRHRTKTENRLLTIYRADCFGTRQAKFEFLTSNSINTVAWNEVIPKAPNYEWVSRNESHREEYFQGFSVKDLFSVSSVGIVTARDGMSIQFTKNEIARVILDFQSLDSESLRLKYNLGKDVRDWKVNLAQKDVINNYDEDRFVKISYRPFDERWTFYTGNSKGFHCMPRGEVMRHLISRKNIGLITVNRSPDKTPVSYYFATRYPHSNGYIRSDSVSIDTVFPLFYLDRNGAFVPNIKEEFIYELKIIINDVTPENIFDYIYAILHSPGYRARYREFLKTEFPRVPYPKNENVFKQLIVLGSELRLLHLFESPKLQQFITSYPIAGSDGVDQVAYKNGDVFINENQFFGNVPECAWNFFIGGYQPAQKWLKDRKGRTLDNSDIEHYQKIIVALSETGRIMKEIDEIDFF
ncbi:MAG: N-6 DNA methylase [Desulfobacterales bacterium]|nr:N-6 DNA methylase [Desulfobacterales bacterium]